MLAFGSGYYIMVLLPNVQEREVLVAMGGGAIIFAVLTLLCAKFITIVSSSIVGSAMIVSSIDFFMHGLKTVIWVMLCDKSSKAY